VRLRAPDGRSERERGAAIRREPKFVHAPVPGEWGRRAGSAVSA
jgi:hypothetical protein